MSGIECKMRDRENDVELSDVLTDISQLHFYKQLLFSKASRVQIKLEKIKIGIDV